MPRIRARCRARGAGGGPSPLVVDWSAATLPAGVTYARTGSIWTVADAAATTLASYAADAWATEAWSDGVAELCVNPAYTNLITAPRDVLGTGWFAASGGGGSVTTDYVVGPDGTAGADRNAVASAGYATYQTNNTLKFKQSASLWLRHPTGSGPYCFWFGINGAAGTAALASGTATTTWRRLALTYDSSVSFKAFLPSDGRDTTATSGGLAPGARDVVTDFHQAVDLPWAPPFTSTSAGATIVSAAGSAIVSAGGHFDVDLATLRPYESASARATDGYLLYLGANDHLRFRASDDKFVLTLNGVAVLATAAQAYAADAAVAVRAWARADGCGITVNGVTVTAATAASSVVPTTAYLFSDGNSSGVFGTRARGRLVALRVA